MHKTGNRTGIHRLSDAVCRNARTPQSGIRKLSDGKGLFLAVLPNGSKLWRMKYRYGGKERSYSIGQYPEVMLGEARERRDEARVWLRDGKDPVTQRRTERLQTTANGDATFAALAEEYFAANAKGWSADHLASQRRRLDLYLLPKLGKLPLLEIKVPTMLDVLRDIERRGVNGEGAPEQAHRCRILASQIFRSAIVTGRLESDPAAKLASELKHPPRENRATIPLKEMPALFKALAKVPAELNTRLALFWLMLTATRTGETRFATWDEIEGGKVWRIPPARMKMRQGHVVPLSTQAKEVLRQARALRTSDDGQALLFPGFTKHGALSENALLALLARAGYYGRQTSHGFRASFSTWAHEVAEADPDIVEVCLAHMKSGVRGIYNRSTYLSKRAALLQAWGDQCTAWGIAL